MQQQQPPTHGPPRCAREPSPVLDDLDSLASVPLIARCISPSLCTRSTTNRAMSHRTGSVDVRGLRCALHIREPAASPPRGLAVVYHGLNAHARYPTVSYAADLFNDIGFAVCAMDLPGHGESEGRRGLVTSADEAIAAGVCALRAAQAAFPGLDTFLVGSSLGGALALHVSLSSPVAGLVLLAPMLALPLHPLARAALYLAALSPLGYVPLISTNSTSSADQYADAARRAECEADPLSHRGRLAPATAYACIDLANRTRDVLPRVTAPFLCLVAGDDKVVNNSGAEALEQHAATPVAERATRHYPGALHGLLCEPAPRRAEIEQEVAEWVGARAGRGGGGAAAAAATTTVQVGVERI